ncbi:MAG: zinc-binding dehydrogenase [Candidatus Krumholzibacteriia bacterium]
MPTSKATSESATELRTEPTVETTAAERETMWALVVDGDSWDHGRGFRKTRVARPRLEEMQSARDALHVVVQVLYAGVCGTDRGIYERSSLGDAILRSLDREGKTERVIGHELVGRIVETGSDVEAEFGYRVGDVVSTESHIFCGRCYQCRLGQTHICSDDRIIGVSRDGGFAEYIRLPARVLWPTDTSRIALEVAAIQEPFGNAVHACTRVDLRGKTVGIFGCGTIGLFAAMIAKSLGATRVVGIEPAADRRELARRAGADVVFPVRTSSVHDAHVDGALIDALHVETGGIGLDVSLEMSGFNSSLNNALVATRRGGEVVLFGLHAGDFTIQGYERVILKGLTLYGVIGRELFRTWSFTRRLLEDTANGIQDKILDLVLHHGQGTILDVRDFEPGIFEAMMRQHPKILLRFAPV